MKKYRKQIIIGAVVAVALFIVYKLINALIAVAGAAFNTVLGIVLVVACIIIAIWMFTYARMMR